MTPTLLQWCSTDKLPLSVLTLISTPVSFYLLPTFPHAAISAAPPLFSTTFTYSFYLHSARGGSFSFRINYRSLFHIFISRRDCTIRFALNNGRGVC